MAIYKLEGLLQHLRRYESLSLPKNLQQSRRLRSFEDRFGYNYPFYLQGRMLSNTPSPSSMAKNDNMSQEMYQCSNPSSPSGSADDEKLPSPGPTPPRTPSGSTFPVWIRWVAGSVLSLLLSFWMPKWGTVLRIAGGAEAVMQEVEHVAEVVEKVATVAEKVSEDVAEQLPDHTKLKRAAMVVEEISKEAMKDAQLAEEIIHKADLVKHDLEGLETLAEPVINKIIDETHDKSKS